MSTVAQTLATADPARYDRLMAMLEMAERVEAERRQEHADLVRDHARLKARYRKVVRGVCAAIAEGE